MAKKTTITVRVDPGLKEWMIGHTIDKRRGLSGFVENACVREQQRVLKKTK
jgi:hypothetical protein